MWDKADKKARQEALLMQQGNMRMAIKDPVKLHKGEAEIENEN